MYEICYDYVKPRYGENAKLCYLDTDSFIEKKLSDPNNSDPNYHTENFLTENLLAIEMRKSQILMRKPVYLGLSVLDLSKTVMYEFWYDYVKPRYGENAKPCYLDTDSFIEKKLFSIRTKLSYYKVFNKEFISSRNEKISNIKE